MTTNFPTGLDALTNPTGSSSLTSPDHAGQHTDANDAIEALEAKVGVDGSAVTTSLDYKVNNINANNITSGTLPDARLSFSGTGVSTGDVSIEMGGARTGSGHCYIDMHAASGTDFESRILRLAGINGDYSFTNTGTGTMSFEQGTNAPINFKTSSVSRMYVDTNGRVGVGTTTPMYPLDVNGTVEATQFLQGTDYHSPYQGFRNSIINGDFRINQRAFTSITASDTYGFDRWAFQASGGTSTMTPQTFTVGSPAATGYESANFCRLVNSGQTLTSHYSILYQKIEDVRTFANSTVTISFWAKAASGTPKIAVEFGQVFGTGGSPSAGVNTYAGQTSIGTSWARYSITATVPSISGKTIGTNANTSCLGINFWVSAGSNFNSRTGSIGLQNNTFDIWGVQVERGSVATPFEQRPIGTELALCQRYYYRFIDGTAQPIGLGLYTFATLVSFYITFPVTMRIAPVLVSSTGTNYYVAAQGFTNDYFNSVTTSQMSNKVAYLYNGTEVSATAGAVYGVYSNDANASIAFNAEL